MSRSHHVTNKQLQQERRENALLDLNATNMTQLEEKKLKKIAAKTNASWSRQSKKTKMKAQPGIRIKNGHPEIA